MIDLPKFMVIWFSTETECWTIMDARLTYKEATEALQRYRGKGYELTYLVGMTYIAGPGDDV